MPKFASLSREGGRHTLSVAELDVLLPTVNGTHDSPIGQPWFWSQYCRQTPLPVPESCISTQVWLSPHWGLPMTRSQFCPGGTALSLGMQENVGVHVCAVQFCCDEQVQ